MCKHFVILISFLFATTAFAQARKHRPNVDAECPRWATKETREQEGSEYREIFVNCYDEKHALVKSAQYSQRISPNKFGESVILRRVTESSSLNGELARFYDDVYGRAPAEVQQHMKVRRGQKLEFIWEPADRRLTTTAPDQSYNHTVKLYRRRFQSHGFSLEGYSSTYGKSTEGVEFTRTVKLANPTGHGGSLTTESCGLSRNSQFTFTIESKTNKPGATAKLEYKGETLFTSEMPGFDPGDDIFSFLPGLIPTEPKTEHELRVKAWADCHKFADDMIKRPDGKLFNIDAKDLADELKKLDPGVTIIRFNDDDVAQGKAAKESVGTRSETEVKKGAPAVSAETPH